MLKRLLKLQMPERKSAFIWGARQTGKSTYLRQKFPQSLYYDLLATDVRMRLEKAPYTLREEICAATTGQLEFPIIIDEIQKVPQLLDEVHWLIENVGAQFILCGSSVRKLRRLGVNLLGGRAIRYHFFPLVYPEIDNFNLLQALNHGLLPSHYLSAEPQLLLEAYVADYINEEIRAEALVRNVPEFARFLDSLAFSHGQMINYANMARDCGVSAKTIANYFQILVDTMLGYFLPPFSKKVKRDVISKMPKFYLFDTGVANYLARQGIQTLRGDWAGRAFEHYILMELMAYISFYKKRIDICYWRSKTGLEVDFVLDKGSIAIEVKISRTVHKQELAGLLAFCEDYHPRRAYVVSLDARPRQLSVSDNTTIQVLPYQHFLQQFWNHQLFT